MRRVKKILKKVQKKTTYFIVDLWGRKELWIDAIFLILIITLMTYIPYIYTQVDSGLGRVILGVGMLIAMAVILVYLIIRIVRRNKTEKLKKEAYFHLVARVLLVSIGIWIFSSAMVNIAHPSMTGIYTIEMSRKDRNIILILNSIFFVLYSQAFITICTGADEGVKEILKHLVKTWCWAMLPVFGMSLIFTLLAEWITKVQSPALYIVNILLTTFLWVTSIAINESIKRG